MTGTVIQFRPRCGKAADPAALVRAARSGASKDALAAALTALLGWPVKPGMIRAWESGVPVPPDVVEACCMLACVAGMALMMGRGRMPGMGGMCGFWRRSHSRAHEADTPVQILEERLARGEIDIGEYLRRLETLADNSPAGSEEHMGSAL